VSYRRPADVIRLDLGDPDFLTPKHVVDEAKRALDEGLTHYGPTKGYPELREAICEHLALFGVDASLDEVIVTPGASFAIYLALKAILKPGDEVLLLTPTWYVYPDIVDAIGATCSFVRSKPDYGPDVDALREAINPKTKVLIINTPNNPTGRVYTAYELRALKDLALDYGLYIISDEVYKMIIYDGLRHVSMASFEDARDHVILVDAFSKAYAMTGWRLGYLVAPQELCGRIEHVQQALIMCVPPFVQRAGIAALRGPQDHVKKMVAEFQARRDMVLELLADTPGVKVTRPQGALYVFPDLSAYGIKASALTDRLRRERGVSVMPGEAFGPGWEYHIRISLCRPREELAEGVRRIKAFLEELSPA